MIVLACLGIYYFFIKPARENPQDNPETTISEEIPTPAIVSEDDADKGDKDKKDNESVFDKLNDKMEEISSQKDKDESKKEEDDSEDENSQPILIDYTELPVVDTTEYRGLEYYDVVFLGDSIFADNAGKNSIPSYFAAYTGARVYNLSRSGMCATFGISDWLDLPVATECFIARSPANAYQTELFDAEATRFAEDFDPDRKLIVFLDCCINDYSMAAPIIQGSDTAEDFYGAYRNVFRRIKEEYPWARIVTMTPYHYEVFNEGTDQNYFLYTQSTYADTLKGICAENNYLCIDLYNECPIDMSNKDVMLRDGLHPTDEGCDAVARTLARVLKEAIDY